MEHQQQMIQQLLEAQTQAQAQQENQLKAQQDMQAALLQCVSSNGDQGRSLLRDTERRVEGLSIPAYHGHLNKSIGLYIHRVMLFAVKNLKYETDVTVEARCLAMVVANLQGQEAAWYQELVSQGHGFTTLAEFEHGLREEFEPSDLQEQLRDRLFALQQKGCKDLVEYIEKFRRVCTDVQEMSQLGKVTFFIRGLKLKTREEVKYCQSKTLSEAI
ncbi:hypothetical protein DYB28_011148 [Aphanomyces astaci]|uniref:Retrotransposon gag domain-containing protein n=1 Tax=Aphanomyces astaci TaxID=112090 RepID=A0A9X8E1U7_APHAT|nr:hypothetical protein DYB28_011148 [Aphanomyces astaci]